MICTYPQVFSGPTFPPAPTPVPAFTSKNGEAQAEAKHNHVSMQRQLSQRGWGQRVSKGYKTQRSGPQASCHMNDLWKVGLSGEVAGGTPLRQEDYSQVKVSLSST